MKYLPNVVVPILYSHKKWLKPLLLLYSFEIKKITLYAYNCNIIISIISIIFLSEMRIIIII